MISNRFSIVLLASALALIGSSAMADYLDTFLSRTNPPPDPIVNPEGNVTWEGWEQIFLPLEGVPIGPGDSIFLGLENIYVQSLWKKVTLEYEAVEAVWHDRTRMGYPPGVPGGGGWDDLPGIQHGYSSQTHRHLVEATINPQPSWEWIELKNPLDQQVNVNILAFTSVCPGPGALALLSFGGLIAHRRRRA